MFKTSRSKTKIFHYLKHPILTVTVIGKARRNLHTARVNFNIMTTPQKPPLTFLYF